ncbi:Multidrug resistance-associated protein 4 [Orchesella cincta]|uniref:Multidrug resistance-associated protein 4 n=1 Tax=Orchesella cincta TaxID=48709 RepID=A0A1D2NI60_ORCCI|nr:Multidrug resistance-associated protein 4 [Orchesella cincta]
MGFHEIRLETSPKIKANPISKLFHLWLLPFLRKGSKKDLTYEDVYEALPEDSSSKLGSIVRAQWDKECKLANSETRQPKLWRAVCRIIWKEYLVIVIIVCFDELGLRIIQPLALRSFIRTFRENTADDDVRKRQFIYAGVLALCALLHPTIYSKLGEFCMHIGMKMRLGTSSIIYEKILKIRKADSEQANVGKLINLLSGDVSRLDQAFSILHVFVTAPVHLGVFSYLLWNELGIASLAGLGCIFFILPFQAKRTDERGRFLNEIVSGIRLIKMYAWEKPFSEVVAKLRRKEIKFIRRHLYLRGMSISLHSMAWKMIPFASLILYAALGNTLTADKAFFTIAVFNIMLLAIMTRLPNAASQVGECLASLNRIEAFLLNKESESSLNTQKFVGKCQETDKNPQNDNNTQQGAIVPSILMANYSASWKESQQTLKSLNLSLQGNKLILIVGHVGAGKSSFLNAILSELPITTGNCHLQGRLSYASQEAWIFPSSLRQNILFGLEMDTERYWKTIKLCCLSDDLKQFPDADLTLVGERGVALSGGVFRWKAENIGDTSTQYLPFADHIIVLNREGGIWGQGTYEELKNSEVDFTSLINKEYFNGDDQYNEEEVTGVTQNGLNRRESVTSEDKNTQKSEFKSLLDGKSTVRKNDEKKDVGSVGLRTYFRYFKLGGSHILTMLLWMAFIMVQLLNNGTDYWLSLWTNAVAKVDEPDTVELHEQTNSSTVAANSDELSNQNFYAYVYCGLIGIFISIVVFRSIIFFWYCMRISINLHDFMFGSLVRTSVKFFDDNPSGRIMNRFTKDLNQIDEHLPITFFDFMSVYLSLFGVVAINVLSNYYAVVPAFILLVSLWKIREFYLLSARDLKRLDAVAKSPMFTHVTNTVQGLTTIRALKAENRMVDQFEKIQDAHTAVYYMSFITGRWFSMWLEIMSATFLAVVSFGFILLTSSADSGNVGVALSTILGLAGGLQWGIRQSAETENYMTSVQRAFEYCNLTPEAPLKNMNDSKVSNEWPNAGRISFKNVSLSYDNLKDNKVLKELTFMTSSKEKVGIVGRTGAGKSSLITALFRLTEPEGVISIDDVPIHDIGLHALRSKISIIPQDPVLFTGSLRYNLDPFDEFVDDQLWRVLQEVDLHNAVQSLDNQVADGGSNFSLGERQLICLARAILRKNRILVLDEATANCDPATDHLVQHTIRESLLIAQY